MYGIAVCGLAHRRGVLLRHGLRAHAGGPRHRRAIWPSAWPRSLPSRSAAWRRKLADEAVVEYVAKAVKLPAGKLTLLVAPAASLAGAIQVVARSIETCLHKLHELKFDLGQVVSALGSAQLPRSPTMKPKPLAAPTTPSSTAAASCFGFTATTRSSPNWAPKCRRRPRRTKHLAEVFNAYHAIFTRSTLCCSARRKWCFAI